MSDYASMIEWAQVAFYAIVIANAPADWCVHWWRCAA